MLLAVLGPKRGFDSWVAPEALLLPKSEGAAPFLASAVLLVLPKIADDGWLEGALKMDFACVCSPAAAETEVGPIPNMLPLLAVLEIKGGAAGAFG